MPFRTPSRRSRSGSASSSPPDPASQSTNTSVSSPQQQTAATSLSSSSTATSASVTSTQATGGPSSAATTTATAPASTASTATATAPLFGSSVAPIITTSTASASSSAAASSSAGTSTASAPAAESKAFMFPPGFSVPRRKGDRAKMAISMFNNNKQQRGAPDAYADQIADWLCAAANTLDIKLNFPDATATAEQVGRFYMDTMHALVTATPPWLLPGCIWFDPNQEDTKSQLAGIVRDPLAAHIFTKALNSWLSEAGKYEEGRKRNVMIRMRNDGYKTEEIDRVMKDPAEVRRRAARATQELRAQLAEIYRKQQSNDPFDTPTASELALMAKHKGWFLSDDRNDDELYPNDNAVNYIVHLFEMIQILLSCMTNNQPVSPVHVRRFMTKWKRLDMGRGTWEAWKTGSLMTDWVEHGCDLGKAMRLYCSAGDRTIQAGQKFAMGHLRSPFRFARIADSMLGRGAWSLLNLHHDSRLEAIKELYRREKAINALFEAGVNMKRGVAEVSIAEASVWYWACSRDRIYDPITGRNDLSGPAMIAAAMNLAGTGLMALDARPWCMSAVMAFIESSQHYLTQHSSISELVEWLDTVRDMSHLMEAKIHNGQTVSFGNQSIICQSGDQFVEADAGDPNLVLHYHLTAAYCLASVEQVGKLRVTLLAMPPDQVDQAVDKVINLVPEVQQANFPVPKLFAVDEVLRRTAALFALTEVG